ncbi:hypothetical protein RhiirC2_756829 [Rhizophagus irregularis]|uniref:Uncharacterized protein n=1 Tax=Rhizophagus irregularis TaxID=588596 RepID=A0A2N1MRY7_9GLOM|nr:hypothetical protein RhiirC2_756829 [Rhizophagus irregularis]
MQSKRAQAYDNWKVYSSEGKLMFRCNSKKIAWYLSRNLANQIAHDSIQLNFQSKGLGHVGDAYHLEDKSNLCVCCGASEDLTMHHVVPDMYRRHMPEVLKSHASYDVLLMCKIAINFNMPLNGNGQSRIRLYNNIKIKKAASALNRIGIPEDRMRELKDILLTWHQQATDKTNDKLDNIIEKALMLPDYERNDEFVEHGKYVVNQLLKDCHYLTGLENNSIKKKWPKLEEFIYLWRDHFLKNMEPKFLSKFWKVNNNIYVIR